MTRDEIAQALKQLAMPENTVHVMNVLQNSATAVKPEELLKTFFCMLTGFIIGDDEKKYLPPAHVAAWMLEAVRVIANTPDVSATPEMLIARLQAIVDALHSATAPTKN